MARNLDTSARKNRLRSQIFPAGCGTPEIASRAKGGDGARHPFWIPDADVEKAKARSSA
jgi:hypothetical protein